MSVIECRRCDGTGAEPDDSPDERTYPCQGCAGTGEAVTDAEHPLAHFIASRDILGGGQVRVICSCGENWYGLVKPVDSEVCRHLTVFAVGPS